jgi:uncharacterized protein (TIGR02145 family)
MNNQLNNESHDDPKDCYLIRSGMYEQNFLDEYKLEILYELLSHDKIDDKFKEVIRDFFIPFKISPLKFVLNKDYYEDSGPPYSFRLLNDGTVTRDYPKHIAPSLHFIKQNPLEMAMGYPEWFYMAFPDVAIWAMKGESFSLLKEKLFKYVSIEEFIDNKSIRNKYLIEIIKLYQNITNKPLECKIYGQDQESSFVSNKANSEVSIASVIIGKQEWMTKNLNVDKFLNGDTIPHAKTAEEWTQAAYNREPAFCYYNNDPANGEKYGKLYNWYAVNDPRGLAPKGWHIPSDTEWTQLTDYLGGEDAAGSKMKSASGWKDNGNGLNSSGFSGLPGGSRDYEGTFEDVYICGCWWSSTEDGMSSSFIGLGYGGGGVDMFYYDKRVGFSVRCLRD